MQDLNKDFRKAYNNISPTILKHIFYRVSNYDLAEDLMQETFLKTWHYLKTKNKKITELKSFIYMVANNLIIDYYRQKDKMPLSLEKIKYKNIVVQPKQMDEVDFKIKMNLLKKNLDSLNNKQKEIITHRFINHKTINEICDITGKSPNYISVIIYQSIKILKENINSSVPIVNF